MTPETRYRAWEQTHDGPCPVCGAVVQRVAREKLGWKWHEIQGTKYRRGSTDAPLYRVLHDYRKHQLAGVPHVGLPFSPNDLEMYHGYEAPALKPKIKPIPERDTAA